MGRYSRRYSLPDATIAKFWTGLLALLLALWLGIGLSLSPAWGQDAPPAVSPVGDVTLGGEVLFTLQDQAQAQSVAERAARISSRIEAVAQDRSIPIDRITTGKVETGVAVYAADVVMLVVTAADGVATEQSPQKLAEQYASAIRNQMQIYRAERSAEYLSRAIVIVIASTLGLLLAILMLANLMPQVYRWLDQQQDHWIPNLRIQNVELLSSQQLSGLMRVITQLLHFILVSGLILVYVPYVLGLFPKTRRFSHILFESVKGALWVIEQRLIAYLPNLITIVIIGLIAFYGLRFLRWMFTNIQRGRIAIPGFYADWAEPTYRLVQFLILAFVAAITFPYLPGASSPAFQGVSIFLGLLVSLGSGGAIVSVVAGLVLVYTRAFETGDRIQVGEIEGYVEEKSLFVTRIRTLNNLLVSIPNAALLSSNILNYNALLRDRQMPMVLSTTITLGYDLPWRLVHETLIAAAQATDGILTEPAPQVWQTALNDFYVNYDLRAYTDQPTYLDVIYSKLHQTIQDKCNEAGIEILSPHYRAMRDGNQSTIPSSYLPEDYSAPGFRLEPPQENWKT